MIRVLGPAWKKSPHLSGNDRELEREPRAHGPNGRPTPSADGARRHRRPHSAAVGASFPSLTRRPTQDLTLSPPDYVTHVF